MTNFIRGTESVGDSSACLQSGKDEFSNELRTFVVTDRHNRCAGCVRCLFRRTVNVAWGLAFPFPRRHWPVRPGSPTRGHVARMASVTFSFLPRIRFFFLLRSLFFSITTQARARVSCCLAWRKKISHLRWLFKIFVNALNYVFYVYPIFD